MASLKKLERRGEDYVLRVLSDESLSTKRQSELLHVLGRVMTGASMPTLARLLGSESRAVRLRAVNLLAELVGVPEVNLLASALSSQDPLTVYEAAKSLGGLADAAALPQIEACLHGHSGALKPHHRWAVIRVVALMRDPAAVGLLAECAVEPTYHARYWAARGLGEIGTAESREALVNATAELSLLRGRFARGARVAMDRQNNDEPPA